MLNSTRLLLLLIAACYSACAQTSSADSNPPKPRAKARQLSFASLKPSATFKLGGTADWVLVTDDAVWVAATKPYSLQRIDPATNRIVAKVKLTGEACSGLAFGFGSVWAPLCGKKPALARVDATTNTISHILPLSSAGPEGGITVSDDSVWLVTDSRGALARIDPKTNSAGQNITIPPGSFNPLFDDGMIWITGVESNVLIPVDAHTGTMKGSIPVGPKPRFLTAGDGSVWTLNQGDGTISRIDEKTMKVVATIPARVATSAMAPARFGRACLARP